MLVWDDAFSGPRPGVLVAHTIRGRTPFEEGKARDLAALGYVAFALDVYGVSHIGSDDANTRGQMDAMKADRPALQKRLLSVWTEGMLISKMIIGQLSTGNNGNR